MLRVLGNDLDTDKVVPRGELGRVGKKQTLARSNFDLQGLVVAEQRGTGELTRQFAHLTKVAAQVEVAWGASKGAARHGPKGFKQEDCRAKLRQW